MEVRNIKFQERNRENFKKLNDFIDNNKDNIRTIICSGELYGFLIESVDAKVKNPDDENKLYYYRGKRLVVDYYSPAKPVNFVLKYNDIKFEMPCICGYYEDEQHLHP